MTQLERIAYLERELGLMPAIDHIPGFKPSALPRDRDLREVYPPVRHPELTAAQRKIVADDKAALAKSEWKAHKAAKKERARLQKAHDKAVRKALGDDTLGAGIAAFVVITVLVLFAVCYGRHKAYERHQVERAQCLRYNQTLRSDAEGWNDLIRKYVRAGYKADPQTKRKYTVRYVAPYALKNCS